MELREFKKLHEPLDVNGDASQTHIDAPKHANLDHLRLVARNHVVMGGGEIA